MIYTISNKIINLKISDKGAEIKSLYYNNTEYIHQDDPNTWNRSAPYLFPNIGAIKENKTIINNQSYPLMKHGFLRDSLFKLVSISESEMVLEFKSNYLTNSFYPFDFIIQIKYKLENKTLISNIEVKNNSNSVMPFNFGLHPAFKVPLFKNEAFEDYTIYFNKHISCQTPTINLLNGLIDWENKRQTLKNCECLKLNYQDYAGDALIFDHLGINQVNLLNDNNKGIRFTFNDFTTLGIWTPNHVKADFICIEPWIGCADSVNHDGNFLNKKDLIKLNPEQIWKTAYSIEILE